RDLAVSGGLPHFVCGSEQPRALAGVPRDLADLPERRVVLLAGDGVDDVALPRGAVRERPDRRQGVTGLGFYRAEVVVADGLASIEAERDRLLLRRRGDRGLTGGQAARHRDLRRGKRRQRRADQDDSSHSASFIGNRSCTAEYEACSFRTVTRGLRDSEIA